jgi:hypothetical protein
MRDATSIVHGEEMQPPIVAQVADVIVPGEHVVHRVARRFDDHVQAERLVLVRLSIMDGLPRKPHSQITTVPLQDAKLPHDVMQRLVT